MFFLFFVQSMRRCSTSHLKVDYLSWAVANLRLPGIHSPISSVVSTVCLCSLFWFSASLATLASVILCLLSRMFKAASVCACFPVIFTSSPATSASAACPFAIQLYTSSASLGSAMFNYTDPSAFSVHTLSPLKSSVRPSEFENSASLACSCSPSSSPALLLNLASLSTCLWSCIVASLSFLILSASSSLAFQLMPQSLPAISFPVLVRSPGILALAGAGAGAGAVLCQCAAGGSGSLFFHRTIAPFGADSRISSICSVSLSDSFSLSIPIGASCICMVLFVCRSIGSISPTLLCGLPRPDFRQTCLDRICLHCTLTLL